MREGEANLDSAENHISRLKENQEKLLIELDAVRARVRETSHVLTDLQVGFIIRFYKKMKPIQSSLAWSP